MQSYGGDFTVAMEEELSRWRNAPCIHDECRGVIDRKGCGTCAKSELVGRISGSSSEISGVRLQDRRAGINSS